MTKENSEIETESSAFEDFGVSNPNEEFIKSRFATIIRGIILERGFEADQAAATLNISESEAIALLKGKFSDFSLKRLVKFPEEVQDEIGSILQRIQWGETPRKTKSLRGFSGVYEIISTYNRSTYRAVYVVNLGDLIYVLHCFQKKSRIGIKTPKKEIDLIRRRLNRAKEHAQQESENV